MKNKLFVGLIMMLLVGFYSTTYAFTLSDLGDKLSSLSQKIQSMKIDMSGITYNSYYDTTPVSLTLPVTSSNNATVSITPVVNEIPINVKPSISLDIAKPLSVEETKLVEKQLKAIDTNIATLEKQINTIQNNTINKDSIITKNLYIGLVDSEVSVLQSKLKNSGYYTGDITGIFDDKTFSAVKSLQTANSITATGYVGVKTRALFSGSPTGLTSSNSTATAGPMGPVGINLCPGIWSSAGPFIMTVSQTAVTQTSATLRGCVDAQSLAVLWNMGSTNFGRVKMYFESKPTGTNTITTSPKVYATLPFHQTFDQNTGAILTPNTTYDYRVCAISNTALPKTQCGSWLTFKTLAVVDPWTTLCSDGKPHIQVLTPNGGETYTAGQQMEVKWKSCGIPSSELLGIVFDSDPAQVYYSVTVFPNVDPNKSVTPNDGQEIITIPTSAYFSNLGNVKIQGKYKLRVIWANNPITITDSSDNYLMINGSGTTTTTQSCDLLIKSLALPNTVLINGVNTIHKFQVKNNSNNPCIIYQLTFMSMNMGNINTSQIGTFGLYDNNVKVGNMSGSNGTSGSGMVYEISRSSTNSIEIPALSTKIYELRGTLSGVSSNQSLVTTMFYVGGTDKATQTAVANIKGDFNSYTNYGLSYSIDK